jgi:hypothetical protein
VVHRWLSSYSELPQFDAHLGVFMPPSLPSNGSDAGVWVFVPEISSLSLVNVLAIFLDISSLSLLTSLAMTLDPSALVISLVRWFGLSGLLSIGGETLDEAGPTQQPTQHPKQQPKQQYDQKAADYDRPQPPCS